MHMRWSHQTFANHCSTLQSRDLHTYAEAWLQVVQGTSEFRKADIGKLRGAAAHQAMEGSAQQTLPLAQGQANTQYATNLPAQSNVQQHRSPLQSVGDPAAKPGYSESAGIDAGQGGDQAVFRASRPNTPDVTDTGSRLASNGQEGTAHLTGTADGMKGSWLTQLVGKATHNAKQASVQLLVDCQIICCGSSCLCASSWTVRTCFNQCLRSLRTRHNTRAQPTLLVLIGRNLSG